MTTRKPKRRSVLQWASQHALYLSAILGLIVAIPVAMATVTNPVASWVDGRIDFKFGPLQLAFDGTSGAVRDLQIEAAEGKLADTKDKQIRWEVEKKKAREQATRELIERQQRELEATRGKLEQQLKTLNEIRSRR